MFDGKFVATLVALIIAVIAIANFSSQETITMEGFGFGSNPSGTWRKERVVAANQEAAMKGEFYSIPGNYQAILSPRAASTDFGAHIRYNMPQYKNQAVPCNPLTFGNMVKENYTENYGCNSSGGGCGPAGCTKTGNSVSYHGGAPVMPADYASGNYNEMINSAKNTEYPDAVGMIPVGDMTTVNALGETIQPIVYDRYIYANRQSRLRSLGDPIRGDLPIVPCSAEWFRPSVHPSLDLQTGAMAVMGGMDNQTGQAMADLIAATSGDTTVAGVNMSSMRNTYTGSALADVHVTAFP